MSNTFRKEYRELTEGEKISIEKIKVLAEEMEEVYNRFPNSRMKSLAMTNLEQSVMWMVKAITE
jgi:hypothetical protein